MLFSWLVNHLNTSIDDETMKVSALLVSLPLKLSFDTICLAANTDTTKRVITNTIKIQTLFSNIVDSMIIYNIYLEWKRISMIFSVWLLSFVTKQITSIEYSLLNVIPGQSYKTIIVHKVPSLH